MEQDPNTVPKVTLNFQENQGDEESLGHLESIDFYQSFFVIPFLMPSQRNPVKYAIQVNPAAPLKLTHDKLEQFIGILYAASLVKMPSTRLYWSKEFHFEKIASTMHDSQHV